MNNQEIINYQKYTKLPLKYYIRADSIDSHLEIETPHGIEIVKLLNIDTGMFKKASEVHIPIYRVIERLKNIEDKVKDELLEKWLSELDDIQDFKERADNNDLTNK